MSATGRKTVFISKATPGDDAFALWLAPKLEAYGYQVFADITSIRTGDRWRRKITDTLQNEAVKMLLCCSDETLQRQGVHEEIGIAEDLVKELDDPRFIMPMRLRPFRKVFGIGELQYTDFHNRWAEGLRELLGELEALNVPRVKSSSISPAWALERRRFGKEPIAAPEVLTSNWARIVSAPDMINLVEPNLSLPDKRMRQLMENVPFPVSIFGSGFLTFATEADFSEQAPGYGTFHIAKKTSLTSFLEDGWGELAIEARDAKNAVVHLMRQAWDKMCKREGFFERAYSQSTAYHANESKIGIGKRVSWGRQGETRNSMLRNVARGRLWEFGISAVPSLFPFPHYRLKGRVLFSEMREGEDPLVIDDKRTQFRLRRSVCSTWRNKAWHGRLMAFLELLAGESPYINLSVGAGSGILVDAMPVQVTIPMTAKQSHKFDEEAEETDPTTLDGYFDESDEALLEQAAADD